MTLNPFIFGSFLQYQAKADELCGRWKAKTTFIDGNRKGESQEMIFDFFPSGDVKADCVEAGIYNGRGIWFIQENGDILYTVRENLLLPQGAAGTLQVTHQVFTLENDTYYSQGVGVLFVGAEPHAQFRSRTITTAHRLTPNKE